MIEQKDIKTLQAEGRGPAPCARFCEATAFNIEIARWKRNQAENLKNQCKLVDQIKALTAERDALTAANKDLQDWFDAIKADHDALKADAERYRYLRSKQMQYSLPNDTVALLVSDVTALDATMEETK